MDRGKKREDGEGNEGTVRAVHDIPVPTGDGPYVHAKRLQVPLFYYYLHDEDFFFFLSKFWWVSPPFH